MCQSWADFGGIGIGPLEWERPALVGLDGIDAAEVVLRQIGARAVWTTLENQALAVWRDFSLTLNEFRFVHSKKRRDTRNLRVRDAHDSVLDAAARPAHPALELPLLHLLASFAAKTTHFLDRIYRIDRIKSVGIAINSVFVLVLKRSRAEIDQESIIYSSRIEIVY